MIMEMIETKQYSGEKKTEAVFPENAYVKYWCKVKAVEGNICRDKVNATLLYDLCKVMMQSKSSRIFVETLLMLPCRR